MTLHVCLLCNGTQTGSLLCRTDPTVTLAFQSVTRFQRTCAFSKYTRQHSGWTRLFSQVSDVTATLYTFDLDEGPREAPSDVVFVIYTDVLLVKRPLTLCVFDLD